MHLLPISRRGKNGIEEWKIIEDYPDYVISNCGRVKRITNGKWPNNAKRGTELKPAISGAGYLNVNLGRNARGKTIHGLVVRAFVGPRPPNFVCNHKDGNKTNNHWSNLEWISASEDIQHAYDNKLRKTRSIEHDGSSLTLSQWANKLNIPRQTIQSRIRYGWPLHKVLSPNKRINQYA